MEKQLSLRHLIANNLFSNKEKLKDVEIESAIAADFSCSWINIKKGLYDITIEFSADGEQIEDISVFKDVVKVVDQEKIC